MSRRCSARAAAWRGRVAAAMILVAALAPSARAEEPRQPSDDAWWTGPLLTPSAGTLPRGHVLIEPYFYDVIVVGAYDRDGQHIAVPREHDYGTQSYLLYGLTDRFTVGVLPRLAYHDRGALGHSSHVGLGDLGVMAQVGLSRFDEDRRIPALAVNLTQTLPIGNYDRLGDHPEDGLGAGAFTTALALYSQYLFWLPTGRILRMRLDATYAVSASTDVRDVSVYGTAAGFRGTARPGSAFTANAAWEYNATRHWAVAVDLAYERDASTSLRGQQIDGDGSGRDIAMDSGSAMSFSVAPAIEYNATGWIGVIAGVKWTVAGRNTGRAVIPVTAINIVL